MGDSDNLKIMSTQNSQILVPRRSSLKPLIWNHYASKWLELEELEVPDGKKKCRNVENAASWPYKSGRGW